jgi:pimeloyl-ACP methyl ester carboxylesterase
VVGSGPPLLMFSPGGFDATLDKWTTLGIYAGIRILDHLLPKYSCIIFDRRESGQSGGRVESLTWKHYVAQGKGLLDHLNIKRAHLMGGCMGCSPVLAFGLAHPEVVQSLICSGPPEARSIASIAIGVSPSIFRLSGSTGLNKSCRWRRQRAKCSVPIQG